ncbi:hypothetical protein BLOT_009040 [Blomia tropicalis]|nr:hypothetical protein BLOT_009040 [Blomia tropicalis]
MTELEQPPAELNGSVDVDSASPDSAPVSKASGGGARPRFKNNRCFNCGQTGHLSYNCRHERNGYRPRTSRCYNCQQEGHISRDCTNPTAAKSCYNCGAEGHISRDCAEPRKERVKNCFNCNEPGHIASKCPTRVNNNS